MSTTSGVGGELYAAFIEKELDQERTRRAAIETRCTSVITTSGSFVTLTFALSALLTKGVGYEPSPLTIVILGAGLIAFVVSAILALLAGNLSAYRVVEASQLHLWRGDEFWLDEKDNARWLLADANTKTLDSLRSGSNLKARKLLASLWSQIVAFALLAFAILVIFIETAT